jgi:hypothetical protein
VTGHTRILSGLDLGQASDFTALVVAEQTAGAGDRGVPVARYAVRHMHRFPLGAPYPAMVGAVRDLFAKPPLAGSHLVVDRTGIGGPVYDLFRASGIRAAFSGWSITAGFRPGDGTVPKKDLVGAVQAVLGTRRLKVAPDLPLAETLGRELEAFRVKVTPDRNETFASWREKDHDDLVLALALAVWTGERLGPPGPVPVPIVMGGDTVLSRSYG